jgi:hypothetical protein
MAGDGVSLPTNLVQLGNLAKTQARGPTATHGPNVAQELQKQDVTPLAKVKETEKAEQDAVDPDEDRREEKKRKRREDEDQSVEARADDSEDETPAEDPGGLGGLIDTKA